jgi:hypothetical protein
LPVASFRNTLLSGGLFTGLSLVMSGVGHNPFGHRRSEECGKSLARPRLAGYAVAMSYTGKAKDGMVVLPSGVQLPEGAQVRVEPLELLPADEPSIRAVLELAAPRPHWPKDYALNHAHQVKGHPKKT